MHLREDCLQRAVSAGFDAVGLIPAEASPRAAEFHAWLAAGRQAGMAWLARDPARRLDPRRAWPPARSVLMVGAALAVGTPPPDLWNDPLRGRVARFAWGPDYHEAMGARLAALAEDLRRAHGWTVAPWPFVDSRPVLERDLAARAGLGFIGKHTQLIHPGFGSYLLLGGLLLPVDIPGIEPSPVPDGCGECDRCRSSCPGGALRPPRTLDARRCVSYWTIENRGPIPREVAPALGNWVFGCDACQEACPYSRTPHSPSRAPFLRFDADLHAPRLADWLGLGDDDFQARYADTALARAGAARLRRNAAAALGNSRQPEAHDLLARAADTETDPQVRQQIALSLARLAEPSV